MGAPQGCDELGEKGRRGEEAAESAWQALAAQAWEAHGGGICLGEKAGGGHCPGRDQEVWRGAGVKGGLEREGGWGGARRGRGQAGQGSDQGVGTGSLCPVVSNTLSPLYSHTPLHTCTHPHTHTNTPTHTCTHTHTPFPLSILCSALLHQECLGTLFARTRGSAERFLFKAAGLKHSDVWCNVSFLLSEASAYLLFTISLPVDSLFRAFL